MRRDIGRREGVADADGAVSPERVTRVRVRMGLTAPVSVSWVADWTERGTEANGRPGRSHLGRGEDGSLVAPLQLKFKLNSSDSAAA